MLDSINLVPLTRGTLPLVPNPSARKKVSHSDVPVRSESPLAQAQDRFIAEWGRMSSSWGINRTMAQIHALLFVSDTPLAMNEIMEKLQISRGNASMNLRELMEWGIVRRSRAPGTRKDTYSSDSDPYQMFAHVVSERKRREIDPTAEAIREVVSQIPAEAVEGDTLRLRQRLEALLEIFELIDGGFKVVFESGLELPKIKEMLVLLTGSEPVGPLGSD